MIRLVQLDRTPEQSWRNHRGSTRVLLSWPPAAPLPGDAWQLRLSVASLLGDAPFSAWPGVRRQLAVLDGRVLLRWPDRSLLLDAGHAAVDFDGADAPLAELATRSARVLNLMTRAGVRDAGLLPVRAQAEWASRAAWRAVYAGQPARLQIDDTDAARLPAQALAFSDHGVGQRWRLCPDDEGQPPSAWWIEARPGAAGGAA